MPRRVGGCDYEKQTAECLMCGEWKPWAAFTARSVKKRSSKPVSSRCDKCAANIMAATRAKNRELLGIPPASPSNENIELREATCTRCKITKPFSEFQANPRQFSRRLTDCWCRKCRSETRKEYRQKNPDREAENRRIRRADPSGRAATMNREKKCRARKEGVPYELEVEWFQEKLAAGVCEATGVQFDLKITTGSEWRIPLSPSADQIVPGQGYTRDNARLVTSIFNLAKNVWTDEDVVSMSYALLKKKGFTVIPPDNWKPTYEKEAVSQQR